MSAQQVHFAWSQSELFESSPRPSPQEEMVKITMQFWVEMP